MTEESVARQRPARFLRGWDNTASGSWRYRHGGEGVCSFGGWQGTVVEKIRRNIDQGPSSWVERWGRPPRRSDRSVPTGVAAS